MPPEKDLNPTVSVPASMTPRESQVLELLVAGKTDKEIAYTLGISEQTVKNHCASIYKKLNVKTRLDVIRTQRMVSTGTRLLGLLLNPLRIFGIDLREFLNVYQEWHALVEGFCEVLCPWPPRHDPSEELLNDLRGEHHYYMWGRTLGVIAWLVIAKIIQAAFF